MLSMSVLDYRITSNANQISVFRARRDDYGKITMNENTNEEVMYLVGYYSTLEKALRGIQRNHIYAEGTIITDLADLEAELKLINQTLKVDLGYLWKE